MKGFLRTIQLSLLALPAMVFAMERSVKGIAKWLVDLIFGSLMPLLFAAALTFFIWGVVEFMRNADNSEDRKKGKQKMLWGIIALTLMVTFLGVTDVFTVSLFNERAFLPALHTN